MSTDCLVLKIEEHYVDTKTLDTTIYVLYDKMEHQFVVRGQRANDQIPSCTFSFNCEFAEELADFITFVICKKNLWTYVLYNYDNLSYNSNDITYEFLDEYDHGDYEIAGYNNLTMNKKKLIRDLRMLKNISNYY